MEKLYLKVRFNNGTKRYIPTVHGKHIGRSFKTATEAQEHSLKLRTRLTSLKAAEQKNGQSNEYQAQAARA